MNGVTLHPDADHQQIGLRAWNGMAVFRSRAGPGAFPEHTHEEVQVSIRVSGRLGASACPAPLERSLAVVESMRPHGGELHCESEFMLAYFAPARLEREAFDLAGRSAVRIRSCDLSSDPCIEAALSELAGALRAPGFSEPPSPDAGGAPGRTGDAMGVRESLDSIDALGSVDSLTGEAMATWVLMRLLFAYSDLGSSARGDWAKVRPLTARQLREAIGILAGAVASPTSSARSVRRNVSNAPRRTGAGVTLDDIAAELGLGVTRFSKAFRATVGMPPHRYLTHLRVRRASHLARTTTMPLAHVAIDCGFSSQSHMTEQMRRIAGITPARLRAAGS